MANDILYLGNKYYSDTEELKKLLEESDENIKEELLCDLRNGNLKQWLLLDNKQKEPDRQTVWFFSFTTVQVSIP